MSKSFNKDEAIAALRQLALLPQSEKFKLYDGVAELEHGFALLLSFDAIGSEHGEFKRRLLAINRIVLGDGSAQERIMEIKKILNKP